jgi:hypothetical protein
MAILTPELGSEEPWLLRDDGKGPRRLVDQGQEANEVDPAPVNLQFVVEQEVLDARGARHHPNEDGLGQRERRIGIGGALGLLVMQHSILDPKHE